MRLFAALPVPEEVVARLDAAVAPLRREVPDLRWTRPEAWHLTVAFLGEVSADHEVVGRVLRPVAAGAGGPFVLRLGAAGRFGARVLWVAVDDEPAGAVAELGSAAQGALSRAGLPVDEKAVHPHITLARSGRRTRVKAQHVEAVPEVEASWEVATLQLMRSQLGGGRPARYSVLDRYPLT